MFYVNIEKGTGAIYNLTMAKHFEAPTVLVLSDTHGNLQNLTAVLAWARTCSGIEQLWFLGDGITDLPLAAERAGYRPDWKLVRGNGDFDHQYPPSRTVEFAGKRFYLTHGHIQAVHDSLDALLRVAAMEHVDGVLFGHTHRPYWEELEGRLVLNPGSLGKPRNSPGPTFATLTVPSDQWFIIRFWYLVHGSRGSLQIRELAM